MATINEEERAEIVSKVESLFTAAGGGLLSEDVLATTSEQLLASKVRLEPSILGELVAAPGAIAALGHRQRHDLLGLENDPHTSATNLPADHVDSVPRYAYPLAS